jgi:hypothetical protein
MGDAGAFVALFIFHSPFLSNECHGGRWCFCCFIHIS